MKKIIKLLLALYPQRFARPSTKRAVEHSVEKYCETYKLLGKHEKAGSGAPILADSENLRGYFQQI